MKKTKLKAAVVGVGNIGADEGKFSKAVRPGTHAGAYASNPDVDLVAFVDVNQANLKSAAQRFKGVKVFTSIGPMLKETKPDIVSVATPTQFHCGNVLEIAQHGCRAILCEKPISYSVSDAKKMIAACRQKKIKLFIDHQRRFDPLLQKWGKKVLQENYLGTIYQGHAYYYNGLYNNGTHLVDLLRTFVGDIVSVVGRYNKKTSSSNKDLNIDGLLFFKNGATVSLHSLSKNYGHFSFSLFGEKGMLEIKKLGYGVATRQKIKNKDYHDFFSLSDKVFTEGKGRSMFTNTIAYIVSCLRGQNRPISTGEDGLAVLQVLSALLKSADNSGQEVLLNNV